MGQLLEVLLRVLQKRRSLCALDMGSDVQAATIPWKWEACRAGGWVGASVRAKHAGASAQPSLGPSVDHMLFLFSLSTCVPEDPKWEWGTHSLLSLSQLWKVPCSHLFLSFSFLPQNYWASNLLIGLPFENKKQTNKTKETPSPHQGYSIFQPII